MDYDIQIIINMFIAFCKVGFPIALVMNICEKLTSIFQDFVMGKNVRL